MKTGHDPENSDNASRAKAPALLILAAGLARRYGSVKPLAPVGCSGDAIIDFAGRDASLAGFSRIVIVVRRAIYSTIKYHIKRCWPSSLEVTYVLQDAESTLSPNQSVPLGTAHAVLTARPYIEGPFGVVNADDIYGKDSYQLLCTALNGHGVLDDSCHILVGFHLRNTVITDKPVKRAVCSISPTSYLTGISERTVLKSKSGEFLATGGEGPERLEGDEMVSVNMWGFQPSIFPVLERAMDLFNSQHPSSELSAVRQGNGAIADYAELLLPDVVSGDLKDRSKTPVRVLESHDMCIGVTHPDDLELVKRRMRELVAEGVYPEVLW